MEAFVAQVISGLAIGSNYALIVVGINLILLVRGVIHFAYAHFIVFSMYVVWLVLGSTNDNFALAISAGIICAVLLTALTEPVFRPLSLRHASLETVIAAMGMAIIITEIMSHFINHGRPIAFPAALVGGGATIKLGMIVFSLGHVYTLIGSIGAVIILLYFLRHNKEGRAFRAMAQDTNIARLIGIPFNKTGIYSFAICGLLGGITGLFMAMTLGMASPSLGDTLAIKALALVLFAGMGNLKGGLICALAVGLIEALTMTYLPGGWTDAIVFGAIMMVILLKPDGLFGARA
jgi:branched-chain amino acid transport system permease protein